MLHVVAIDTQERMRYLDRLRVAEFARFGSMGIFYGDS